MLVGNGPYLSKDQEIDSALAQISPLQLARPARHDMNHNARMAPGKPIDDGRYEARGQRGCGSDPYCARGRIGEEFDVLHALPQLIEGRVTAVEHGAAELRELDAARVPLEQTYTKGVLQ